MCRRDCHAAQLKYRISHRRTVSDTIRPYDRSARRDDAILEPRFLWFEAYESFDQSRSCEGIAAESARTKRFGSRQDSSGREDLDDHHLQEALPKTH